MVGVLAGKLADVQRDAGVGGEGMKNSFASVASKAPTITAGTSASQYSWPRPEMSTAAMMRASSMGMAMSPKRRMPRCRRAPARTPAHDDARVLHRVMTVHLKVALAAHLQVEQAVAPERGEHVVEKPDARLHVRFARAVKADGQVDVGFLRGARDARNAFAHCCSPFFRRVRGDSGQITLRPKVSGRAA